LIGINAVSADMGDLEQRAKRGGSMITTETLTQPVSGWLAWCLSARGIPGESRNPVKRKTTPDKTPTQETSHAG